MKHSWKHVLSLLLAAAMLFALVCPALADTEDAEAPSGQYTVTWEKIDAQPRGFNASLVELAEDEAPYGPNDNVRVSIVMEQAPAIRAGFSKRNIGSNASVQSYRDSLRLVQDSVAQKISTDVLGGAKLDVVWNLTLAANLISANVPYGKIEAIKAVPGVKDVIVETQYYPTEETKNINGSQMVGTTQVWASGYTGAGSIVAIIDTGLDTDHELFDEDAFEYSLEQTGKDVDLLTASEVSDKWRSLHASEFISSVNGVYLTSKVPFAVNYVDRDLDVTHDYDDQGEHGSHVAGIAAANRFVKRGDKYVPALGDVYTQGEAPDAQILVMKVFGKGGGAYDSDYMVAIEDAIVLGADSVNLSLGSSVAGFVTSEEFQDVVDSFADSDTVISISMGNAADWAGSSYAGSLYSDGSNFYTGGSPGSYANALTVASVDNDGITGMYVTAYGNMVFYTESLYDEYGEPYGNTPLTSILGEQEFVYVDTVGVYVDDDDNVIGDDFAAIARIDPRLLQDKIVICNRGTSSFYMKANAAVTRGAKGVIIVNNQPGAFGMDLTGYTKRAPVVSITRADGNMLKSEAKPLEIEGFKNGKVYSGRLTVEEVVGTTYYDNPFYNYTMSSFSSWGVPGDLSLKPEITAPGGNIWSVNGIDGTYENMSGTSMASPQIAGVAALVAEYIREEGLVEKTGLSQRQLINSLLMSTAVPLYEANSGYNYYSVMLQGAGLVNADAAISADSYILMDANATDSAADGKIKAELGDDPARTGSYSFSFTINNLTDKELYYDLEADFFTQDIYEDYDIEWRDTWTALLGASVSWTLDGEPYVPGSDLPEIDFNGDETFDAQDAVALLEYVVKGTQPASLEGADFNDDGEITTYDAYLALTYFGSANVVVPASGSVRVGVSFTLLNIDDYDDCGNYVEGFVYAYEQESDDGAYGTVHSIPVLGYYGSWSEPTMHDVGSRIEYYGGLEFRPPYLYVANGLGEEAIENETYLVEYGWTDGSYPFGGNPIYFDDEYVEERNAISADSVITGLNYTLIRNSVGTLFTAKVGDKTEEIETIGERYATYLYQSDNKWHDTKASANLDYALTGAKEGDPVELNFLIASEYYLDDGEIDWDAIVPDSGMSIKAYVDNTAPEIAKVGVEAGSEGDIKAVTVIVDENRYVAALFVWNEKQWLSGNGGPLVETYGDLDEELGAGRKLTMANGSGAGEVDFRNKDNLHLMVEVYDYAANVTTYKINLAGDTGETPTAVTVTPAEAEMFTGTTLRLTADVEPWGIGDDVTWSSDNEKVATVNENGVVTALTAGRVTITAASKIEPKVSGTAAITVKELPDRDLNAILWDEQGAVKIVEFNTADLFNGGNCTALTDNLNVPLVDMAWDIAGETIYASDNNKTLYTLDPETYALSAIGTGSIPFYGMAPSAAFPELTGNNNAKMISVYANYLVGVNVRTGAYYGAIDLTDEEGFPFAGNYAVGLAYWASYVDRDDQYIYLVDDYFIIDNKSNYYLAELAAVYDIKTQELLGYAFVGEKLGSFKAPVGNIVDGNSLYVDEDLNLYWGRLGASDSSSSLYIAPFLGFDEETYMPVYDTPILLKTFDYNVYPVVGLIELETSGEAGDVGGGFEGSFAKRMAGRTEEYLNADILKDVEVVSVEKTETGRLDSVSVNSVTLDPIDPPEVPNPEGDFIVTVKANETSNNGLITFVYDADALELLSAKSPITSYSAINTEVRTEEGGSKTGEVTIGYASLSEIAKDDAVLVLTFKELQPTITTATVTTVELDDEKPGTTEEVDIGHLEYTGPEWVWSDDYKQATAVFTRVDDPEKTVEVEATVTYKTTPAHAYIEGKTVYTAVAEFNGITYTATVVVIIPAIIPDPPTPPAPEEEIGDEGTPLGDDTSFPFEDVYEDDWYYDAVYEMYKAGYIKGTSETTYEPDQEITRGQIVTILFRIDGENKVDGGVTFEDVKPGAFYYDAVAWASANKIVNGYSETEFAPDDSITREQFAAIVYRYAQFKGQGFTGAWYFQLDFDDAATVSDWADEAMHWCVMNGVINGYDGKLDPQGTADRAQAAVIFDRLVDYLA